MAYTNRTIRLAFDGSDENFPVLGDDIWVVIANPMLMPPSKLRPKVEVQIVDGKPVDEEAATRGGMEVIANLIVDWCVYDSMDFSENPERLSLPATYELLDRVPMAITTSISEILNKALNPR